METKQKFEIVFNVEMTERDAWELLHELDDLRHHLNERRKWDVSRDMPNSTVRPKP